MASINIFETTGLSNVNYTTVFASYQPGTDHFVAVTSRHLSLGIPGPIPFHHSGMARVEYGSENRTAMFNLITIVAALVSLVLAFLATPWAQIPLAVVTLLLYMIFFGVRGRRYGPVPELSSKANEMLTKFGHFYAMPFAGRDVSAASSGVALAAILVGIISAFRGFWWGLGVGILIYLVVAPLGRQFNPANFLTDEEERAAHDEIVNYMVSRRTKV